MKEQKTIAEKVRHFLAHSDFYRPFHGSVCGSWSEKQLIKFVQRVVQEEKK
ncbi:hypothetical protein LCGC14_1065700 [marine sediment metagenome]|uniref:Uncharacterized protein n=1 Tax=marine sediment metagenome TaxID=412755 RepID=A0A0F9MPI3_9ZZZZ